MTERIVAGGFVSTLSATLRGFIMLVRPWLQPQTCGKFARVQTMDCPALLKAGFSVDAGDGSAQMVQAASKLTDLDEPAFLDFIANVPELRNDQTDVTRDVRPVRSNEKRLNA